MIILHLATVLLLLVVLRAAQAQALWWRDQATQLADLLKDSAARNGRLIELSDQTLDLAKQVPILQQRLDRIADICASKEAQQIGLQLGSESFKSVKRWADWRNL